MKKRVRHSGGFTMAELLIVVAIIAVLTAIAIPVFHAQMENSREAADAANIRALYAEVMVEANDTGADVNTSEPHRKVPLVQTGNGWNNEAMGESIGHLGTTYGDGPVKGGYAWVEYSTTNGVSIHYSSGSDGTGGETGGGNSSQPSLTQEQSNINWGIAQSIGETIYNSLRSNTLHLTNGATFTIEMTEKGYVFSSNLDSTTANQVKGLLGSYLNNDGTINGTSGSFTIVVTRTSNGNNNKVLVTYNDENKSCETEYKGK